MASARELTADDVSHLRILARDMDLRIDYLGDAQLLAVLVKVGDVGVAADALAMPERPRWLMELVGAIPR